jgi:predicted nucleic acid-binding protein
MKQILLDTDVILDLYLDRDPFADDAAALWEAHEAGHLTAYVSAITPVNLFYVARKLKGRDVARQAVTELLATLPICAVDLAVLQSGLAIAFKDFEDAVQHASAAAAGLEGIVTRNVADYRQASLPIFTPADFLSQFSLDA